MSHRRLALVDHANGLSELLVVACSDLLDSGFSVESHSDCLVGLDKLVELLGELLILDGDDSDVVVQRVDFDLQVRVVVQESRIAVAGALELLSHVHDLVLLRSDLRLQVLYASC